MILQMVISTPNMIVLPMILIFGCRSHVMLCSTGLGKAVKDRMRKKFDAHYDDHTDDWIDGIITASERRVLYATWLSEAWKEFFAEGGQDQVRDRDALSHATLL